MKRTYAVLAGVTLGVVASVTMAVTALTAPDPQPYGKPIGPDAPADTGAGELLLVVVGGIYPTRAEAQAANDQMAFGDLQGYYVVPVAQFQGFRRDAGSPGDFALVSAFRTQAGAEEFVGLAEAFGHPATLLPERVRSLGGVYAGLGQETAPDGSGPLLGPVEESLP
ncbi:MAG TPA: hypothetical protein VFK59_11320 [Actinomycetota bacterium]|nr:hypothetical protein [Actinomycetota bacterium]